VDLFIYFWKKDTLLTKGTRGTIHPELESSSVVNFFLFYYLNYILQI